MESILSALIAGAVTLIGVLIANSRSQAVTDTKLEELTREVREHNNFARRVPILEEQMKVANHRIADLENHERMKESSWSPPASPPWPPSSAGGRTTASPLPPWPPTATWPG